jgi:hypothetical protein
VFDLVEHYGSMPHHRTGTEYDHETIEWLAAMLRKDGAAVAIDRWSFPQWTAEWSAEIDGHAIDAIPTFYEMVSVSDEPLIVATPHPNGRLYATNRHPIVESVSRPTINIAGRYTDQVDDVVACIDNVRIVDGWSANVRAHWNGHGPLVVIATPISGWFSCASERGCGIAIARHLALALAIEGRAVDLLFTSGHELFNIGLTHHLVNASYDTVEKPAAVVHVGASVAAAGPGTAGLSSQLFVTANRDGAGAQLASLGFHQRTGGKNEKDWIGEARQWQNLGVPLLSVAGASDWFHTPDDVATVATSAQLLDIVSVAFLDDVRVFLDR